MYRYATVMLAIKDMFYYKALYVFVVLEQDKNGFNGPAFLWQKIAKITMGIKIDWKWVNC